MIPLTWGFSRQAELFAVEAIEMSPLDAQSFGFGGDNERMGLAGLGSERCAGSGVELMAAFFRRLGAVKGRSSPAATREARPVCRACPASWGCKSPVQPDGGEALAKRKGGTARDRLKEAWSKVAT